MRPPPSGDLDETAWRGPPSRLTRPALFWLKVGLLAATTLAFVPVLLMRTRFAGALYVTLLVLVHVAGLAVIAIGSGGNLRGRGVAWRLGAIVFLFALLALVAPGLRTTTGWAFWGLLGFVWFVHSVGLLVLHWRGQSLGCPLVPADPLQPAPGALA